MPPAEDVDIVMEDENYASSEDSDFAPENVADQASAADSDEEDEDKDGETTMTTTTRKAAHADEAEDAGFENSGDEAIIGKGKKRRRRDEGDGEDGDGGVGGFVKTRNQRANEKAERRAAAVQGPVTVDVDALFSQMMGGGSDTKQPQQQPQTDLSSLASAAMFAAGGGGDDNETKGKDTTEDGEPKKKSSHHTEMIKIKRTYNFAGQVHTEEKIVARDSAEAKLYLEQVGADNVEIIPVGVASGEDADVEDDQPKRLPPRKAFRSAFEPVLDPSQVQLGARTDLDLGLAARLQARERAALLKAQQQGQEAKKLTTVEKSRMDWAGFVDREGIQDELAVAGKSKGAFVDRQQFLARTEMRREEEARRARMAGKV